MIPELAALLKKAVEKTLEDRVAIAFSGGIDSSLIAQVAKGHSDVELFICGTATSEDLAYARKVAYLLKLPLQECIVDEKEVLNLYELCFRAVPGDLLKVELLVPAYKIAEEARKRDHRELLFGSASEELLVGYERYYRYAKEGKDLDRILEEEFNTLKNRDISATKKICWKQDMEARFPFYNEELAQLVFSVPLERRMENYELKKGLLREAGKLLGLPEAALQRKKRAMQYGSGIHKILLKHADELNRKFEVK